MSTVVQPWIAELPWKQQSILFSSLRGPDQELLTNIKQYSKWMRSVTQNNADPSKPYMNDIVLPPVEALYKELEHCPCHFVHHFLDGMAIIAYGHTNMAVAELAARVHYQCAEEIFHFVPEDPSIFMLRHRDKIDGNDEYGDVWGSHVQRAYLSFLRAALSRFTARSDHENMQVTYGMT
jgi:hypothetical protein